MSSATAVHFIGGPLGGRSLYLKIMEINFKVYNLYPTILDNQSYGIPKIWEVQKLGYAEVISITSMIKNSMFDVIEVAEMIGKEKIEREARARDAVLLPLTIKTQIEDYEFFEGFEVKSVQISALAALPS